MYSKIVILSTTISIFLPILGIKPTIGDQKARQILYEKKSYSRHSAYNECYNVLGHDPSLATYPCLIIAEHLYQAKQHLDAAREYCKSEREKAISDIAIINKDIQTLIDTQNKMAEDTKDDPELKMDKTFATIAADIRNKKRNLETQKKALEKKEELYTHPYWDSLTDQDIKDLRWALTQEKLCKDIDREMNIIEKDLKHN